MGSWAHWPARPVHLISSVTLGETLLQKIEEVLVVEEWDPRLSSGPCTVQTYTHTQKCECVSVFTQKPLWISFSGILVQTVLSVYHGLCSIL